MARAYTPGNNLPLLPWLAHMNRLWKTVHGGGPASLLQAGAGGNDAHRLHDGGGSSLRRARGQRRSFRGAVPRGGGNGRAFPLRRAAAWTCLPTSSGSWAIQTARRDHGGLRPAAARVTMTPHRAVAGRCSWPPARRLPRAGSCCANRRAYAREHCLGLHSHCGETVDEDAYSQEHFGMRPVEYFADCGWDFEGVWFAHGIHFTDEEVAWLGRAKDRRRPLSLREHAPGQRHLPGERSARGGREGGRSAWTAALRTIRATCWANCGRR